MTAKEAIGVEAERWKALAEDCARRGKKDSTIYAVAYWLGLRRAQSIIEEAPSP